MKISRHSSLAILPLLASLAGAQTEQQQARIARLEHAVLAPCCYTEPVAVHQSEIAVKTRLEIARWVEMGKSDREILDTYVARYGNKVLVDPGAIPAWWAPWVPWMILAMGTALLTWFLKRWRRKAQPPPPSSEFGDRPLPDLDDDEAVL